MINQFEAQMQLECAAVVGSKGVALGVSPLVHVEGVNVLAGNLPLLQEVDDPLVHTHRTNGQDHSQLLAGFLGQLHPLVRVEENGVKCL